MPGTDGSRLTRSLDWKMAITRQLRSRVADAVTGSPTRRMRPCLPAGSRVARDGWTKPCGDRPGYGGVYRPHRRPSDLGLAPFVERTLTEAARQQAAAVVLEISTFGGRVDAAVLIRDAVLRTPVAMGAPGGSAQQVEKKTVSYMRKELRATAEARKRPPLIAEAMDDVDVEVPGLSDKGTLLTLTTGEERTRFTWRQQGRESAGR